MLDKKNLMDDSDLLQVNGGTDLKKGVDEMAARTIRIPCNSATCKGEPRMFDIFQGGTAICRVCQAHIII